MATPYPQKGPTTWGPPGPQVFHMAVPMNYGVIKSPAKELYLKRWIIVPILQLIFAIIAAGFGAYCLYEDGSVGLIFMICAATCSTGISIWLICALSCAPRSLKPVVALPLDIIALLFRIATLGLMEGITGDLPSYFHWSMVFSSVFQASACIIGIEIILYAVGMIGDSIAVHRERRLRHGMKLQQFPPQQLHMQPNMHTRAPYSGFRPGATTVQNPEFVFRPPMDDQSGQNSIPNVDGKPQHELDPQTMQPRELGGITASEVDGQPPQHELDPQTMEAREFAGQGPTPELSQVTSPASPFSYRGDVNQPPVELPTRP